MNVLNRLEPRHPTVVDVMSFIVKDGEFLHLTDDFTEVRVAVGCLTCRRWAKGLEEVVAKVIILEGGLFYVTKIDPVNVRQKEVARIADHSDVILNMERQLKFVAPILAFEAVVRQDRVIEENFEAVEISAETI
jgi:hypothetical protein